MSEACTTKNALCKIFVIIPKEAVAAGLHYPSFAMTVTPTIDMSSATFTAYIVKSVSY